MAHYYNNAARPVIHKGDQVVWETLRSGNVVAEVIDVDESTALPNVKMRVLSRSNATYRPGQIVHSTTLHIRPAADRERE